MSTANTTTTTKFQSFIYYFLDTGLDIRAEIVKEEGENDEQIQRLKKSDNYFETLGEVVNQKASYLSLLNPKL